MVELALQWYVKVNNTYEEYKLHIISKLLHKRISHDEINVYSRYRQLSIKNYLKSHSDQLIAL